MKDIGPRIKRIRESLKLSQAELAERAGVHQTQISHVELGRHGVTLATVEKLATALGVTVPELLSDAVAVTPRGE